MLDKFNVLLLDMNVSFMFDADRFSYERDYSTVYHQLGGTLESSLVNTLIQSAYDYLDKCYPDPKYREFFPSVRDALTKVASDTALMESDLDLLIQTFGHHELGYIPSEYSIAIRQLSKQFRLGLVADIWAPKPLWIEELIRANVLNFFDKSFFSSDWGIVKPSPHPFLTVLEQMRGNINDTLVIGDSVRRDLGGAVAAGLPCLLVGGASHPLAYGSVSTLLDIVDGFEPDS